MATYTITFKVSPNSAYGRWSSASTISFNVANYDYATLMCSYNKFWIRAYTTTTTGYKYEDLYERRVFWEDGYEFSSITGFTSGDRLKSNVTVTAVLTLKTFTTSYLKNLNGSLSPIYSDTNCTLPYQVKYVKNIDWYEDEPYYKFKSWNTRADDSGTTYKQGALIKSWPGSSLPLYAQWTPITYTINFSHNAGGITDPSGSSVCNGGSTKTVTAIPSQDYYYLDHWELVWSDGSSDTKRGDTINFTVKGNGTIKAIFEKMSYTLSVKASPSAGGTVGGGGTAKYGSYLNIFANANLGYKFDHWDGTDGGYGTGASRNVKIVENTTYTAYFTPKTYTVKINTNGGKWLEDEPESTFTTGNNIKTFDTPAQLMSNVPYKFGYQFSGWGWRKDNTGDFTYIYEKGGTFDDKAYTDLGGTTTQITLYAVWTPIKNTIKYHYYIGDTSSDAEIIDTDTYTIETPNPYKYYDPKNQRGENSTFLGWARVKPDNWGEASQEGHGNYPVPSNVPVLYDLPYEVNISNIKDTTQDNSQWGTTVDVYGFWTVTGKYININGTWKKVNTAYIRTDTGWKVITDMYINISDDPDNPNWKHEVII